MKKFIFILLSACAFTGCESLNNAWKSTTDYVKGPIAVEAEEAYLEDELYSSGTGRCLSFNYSQGLLPTHKIVGCPKNLSVPYIVKGVSSADLGSFDSFGGVKAKEVAYNADTAKAFYLELKPADDPMASNRIYAIFTEKELKNRAAPTGFVRKEGVGGLKAKDAEKARQQKEKAEEEARLQKEKAEEEARLQKEKAEKEKAELLQNIAQCRSAYETAKKKREGIGDELITLNGRVVDFADDGVMIMKDEGPDLGLLFTTGMLSINEKRIFVYTSDTDYATDEKFKDGGYLYKRVGNYRYTTVSGGVNSVPAYEATKYKKNEIDPKTYLSDKSLKCCFSDTAFGINYNGTCYTEKDGTLSEFSYF